MSTDCVDVVTLIFCKVPCVSGLIAIQYLVYVVWLLHYEVTREQPTTVRYNIPMPWSPLGAVDTTLHRLIGEVVFHHNF